MPWIDSTYFHGEILIPGLSGTGPVYTANLSVVNSFIAKYEPEYLKFVLGEDFYDELIAGLAESTPDAKWTALKAKFLSTETFGSGETAVTYKFSPIAGYVYYKYMRDRHSFTTGIGEVKANAENGTMDVSAAKMIRAYNDAMMAADTIREWLDENSDSYSGWTWTDLEDTYTINSFGL